MQSFFSQTLTVLNLLYCENVALTLFLVCPNLKELHLDHVEGFDPRDSEYHDTQCSGRELPALEYLDCRNSESLLNQMISPPPEFSMAVTVVVWSKLRILKLCLQEKEGMMACLQPILDATCNTLEELYLTNTRERGFNAAGKKVIVIVDTNLTSLSRTTKSRWPSRPKTSSKPPHLCNSFHQV
jgi:hypothetical protein